MGSSSTAGQKKRKTRDASKVRQSLAGPLQNRGSVQVELFLLIHDKREEDATTSKWISPQTLFPIWHMTSSGPQGPK
jgi:hypothetical protein